VISSPFVTSNVILKRNPKESEEREKRINELREAWENLEREYQADKESLDRYIEDAIDTRKMFEGESKDSPGYQHFIEQVNIIASYKKDMSVLRERFQQEGDELKRELKSLTGKAAVLSLSRAGSGASNSSIRTPITSPLRSSAPTVLSPVRIPAFEESKVPNMSDANVIVPQADVLPAVVNPTVPTLPVSTCPLAPIPTMPISDAPISVLPSVHQESTSSNFLLVDQYYGGEISPPRSIIISRAPQSVPATSRAAHDSPGHLSGNIIANA
jgi:hypothetical protein